MPSTLDAIRRADELSVYQQVSRMATLIDTRLIPRLRRHGALDSAARLYRASRMVAPLIAVGFTRRRRLLGCQPFLYQAIEACHHTIAELSRSRDMFRRAAPDDDTHELLVDAYDAAIHQLYRLIDLWTAQRQRAPGPHRAGMGTLARLLGTPRTSPDEGGPLHVHAD